MAAQVHKMTRLQGELATDLVHSYELAKTPYDIPILPQAQCIVIPLIRETIAPIIVRNNDADTVTDTNLAGVLRVLMIASKTKGVERRRGAQVLRALDAGGYAAANKAYIARNTPPGNVLDLNSFVFGDSANGDGGIYPVHANVLYSDAVSIQPRREVVYGTFRQGGIGEENVTYDAEKGGTSSNIFTTRYVAPGTYFVQTLVIQGRRMTMAALDHLLLSIGLAGAYGGSTATTGTNLKTHWCGMYWGHIEREINAPGVILEYLAERQWGHTAAEAAEAVETLFREGGENPKHRRLDFYPHSVPITELEAHVENLVRQLESGDKGLTDRYQLAKQDIAGLFNAWFTGSKAKKGKRGSPKP